ncbi:MAG: hypothetical protein NC120_12930 [Ruminococcus sp.]|nr:hypothetical protein [Ruminococcus sp.]
MADKDILNVGADNLDDFELPPLPKLPPKKTENGVEDAPKAENIDNKLPPLPPKTVDNSLDEITDIPADADLPPMPKKTAANSLDEISAPPESAVYEDNRAGAAEIDTSGDDFELPPLPEIKKEKSDEEIFDFEETEPEPDTVTESRFEFTEDYSGEIDDIVLGDLEEEDIVVDEATALAPLTSGREASARNIKESVRLNDMAMELQGRPVLDDLSDDYTEPKKKAVSLVERDKLDDDEKRVLKQRLEEDLSKRPENFNARASRNMYNRLMEEKNLKIAQKGFAISVIPILMGLGSAVIAFLKLNWGDYLWFQYVAMFMVVAALLLFAKSKHIKMLSTALYAVCLLLYVGPGLVLFVLDEEMRESPDMIVHLIFAVAASALNIISIIILSKNEAVNVYYNTKFSRKR